VSSLILVILSRFLFSTYLFEVGSQRKTWTFLKQETGDLDSIHLHPQLSYFDVVTHSLQLCIDSFIDFYSLAEAVKIHKDWDLVRKLSPNTIS